MIRTLLELKWKEERQESEVLSQDLAPSSSLYEWLRANRGLNEKQAGMKLLIMDYIHLNILSPLVKTFIRARCGTRFLS